VGAFVFAQVLAHSLRLFFKSKNRSPLGGSGIESRLESCHPSHTACRIKFVSFDIVDTAKGKVVLLAKLPIWFVLSGRGSAQRFREHVQLLLIRFCVTNVRPGLSVLELVNRNLEFKCLPQTEVI
jgi:hypothetical protein